MVSFFQDSITYQNEILEPSQKTSSGFPRPTAKTAGTYKKSSTVVAALFASFVLQLSDANVAATQSAVTIEPNHSNHNKSSVSGTVDIKQSSTEKIDALYERLSRIDAATDADSYRKSLEELKALQQMEAEKIRKVLLEKRLRVPLDEGEKLHALTTQILAKYEI